MNLDLQLTVTKSSFLSFQNQSFFFFYMHIICRPTAVVETPVPWQNAALVNTETFILLLSIEDEWMFVTHRND